MKIPARLPVLIIHGGAGRAFTSQKRAGLFRRKIAAVLDRAYERLLEENALESVIWAVRLLEDDPLFNAGTGSMLQADGVPRLTASVMDGKTRSFAAVLNVEKVRNPVLTARALLREESRVLAAREASRFARDTGLAPFDVRTPAAVRLWKKKKSAGSDTVGACALDSQGHLASATSTGGRGMERPGRVSDSGMPAANYASPFCAVSATGHGEDIIDEALACRLACKVEDGSPLAEAFVDTFCEMKKRRRRLAAIGVDRSGSIAHASTTEVLIYGWRKGRRSGLF